MNKSTSGIKPFTCLVAFCRKNNGIGMNNGLPWPFLKKDMGHFQKLTTSTKPFRKEIAATASSSLMFNSVLKAKLAEKKDDTEEGKQNAVIMGRKTWESLPKDKRPLKGRLNVVLTKSDNAVEAQENVRVFNDFEQALSTLSSDP